MTRNVRILFLFLLLPLAVSGCFRYASPIYSNDALEPSKGYFYGRFSSEPGFNFGATYMGVVATSTDKEREIAMRFEQSTDPYAVAVEPGDYQVTHFVYSHGAGNKDGEKPFPEELAGRVIHVEAGKAYYLGDYDGASKSTYAVLFVAMRWRIGKVSNDFAGTTAKLDQLFPQMKDVPKVDVFGDALASAFTGTSSTKGKVAADPTPLLPLAK